jgi:hypothetical protein
MDLNIVSSDWNGKNWSTLADGSAIGHKRIDIFAPVTASRVRLHIVVWGAWIREFLLFNPLGHFMSPSFRHGIETRSGRDPSGPRL